MGQLQPVSPPHQTVRLYFLSYILSLTSLCRERGIYKMLSDGSAAPRVLKRGGNAHAYAYLSKGSLTSSVWVSGRGRVRASVQVERTCEEAG